MSVDGFNKLYVLIDKKLNISENKSVFQILEFLKFTFLLLLLVYCIMNVASGSYNPFIYFRF